MSKNADDPIYPVTQASHYDYSGLTKREYFAAMALSSGKSAEDAVAEADKILKLLDEKSA